MHSAVPLSRSSTGDHDGTSGQLLVDVGEMQSPTKWSQILRFNHVANRVNPGHFEIVVDMFVQQLVSWSCGDERAVWLRQTGANVDLQLSRSDTGHRDADRERSQVSFLSDTPEADLRRLASWFTARGLPPYRAYSDKELFLRRAGRVRGLRRRSDAARARLLTKSCSDKPRRSRHCTHSGSIRLRTARLDVN